MSSCPARRKNKNLRQKPSYRPKAFSNFNPRPPRGGRHSQVSEDPAEVWISIHALREEDGFKEYLALPGHTYISIHALREEDGAEQQLASILSASISIHALREEDGKAADSVRGE